MTIDSSSKIVDTWRVYIKYDCVVTNQEKQQTHQALKTFRVKFLSIGEVLSIEGSLSTITNKGKYGDYMYHN